MVRSARSSQPEKPGRPPVQVHNEKLLNRIQNPGDNSKPIRTVFYLEVGDMKASEVHQAFRAANAQYAGNQHPTFAIPLRRGVAYTDVLFEQEALDLIRNVCEVRDGKIVFKKHPPQAVDVLRTQV